MIRRQRLCEPQAKLLQSQRDRRQCIVDLSVDLERRDDGVKPIVDRRGRWSALQCFVNEQAEITLADDWGESRSVLRERVAEKGQGDRCRAARRDL